MMDDPTPAAPARREAAMGYPQRGTRRAQPRAEESGARTRAAAQRHLDGRAERLRAYAAALEASVAAGPSTERRAQLERQLAGVRLALQAAVQARLPAPAERRRVTVEPVAPPPDAPDAPDPVAMAVAEEPVVEAASTANVPC
jgi:hypothetical protein